MKASYCRAALALVCVTAGLASAMDEVPATSTGFVTVSEIYARGIAGYTGEPMGTIISVHGKLIDGASLGRALPKLVATSTYLDVDRVGDRTLSEPVRLRLAARPEHMKQTGEQVTCRGYETGGYSGIVDDPIARKNAGGGQHSFFFDFVFVPLKESAIAPSTRIWIQDGIYCPGDNE